jgi:hypothetical protein
MTARKDRFMKSIILMNVRGGARKFILMTLASYCSRTIENLIKPIRTGVGEAEYLAEGF